MADNDYTREANPDPITGEPGSHPVGTGAGALGGAVAGAVAGTAIGGPVGAVVGGVAGAVGGAAAGHGLAEAVNPTVEDAYWRETYMTRPYVSGEPYDVYQPAYRYAWESYPEYRGRRFDEVESDLKRGWEKTTHAAKLGWEKAKHATRDAWHRIERALPGDFDKDGR